MWICLMNRSCIFDIISTFELKHVWGWDCWLSHDLRNNNKSLKVVAHVTIRYRTVKQFLTSNMTDHHSGPDETQSQNLRAYIVAFLDFPKHSEDHYALVDSEALTWTTTNALFRIVQKRCSIILARNHKMILYREICFFITYTRIYIHYTYKYILWIHTNPFSYMCPSTDPAMLLRLIVDLEVVFFMLRKLRK